MSIVKRCLDNAPVQSKEEYKDKVNHYLNKIHELPTTLVHSSLGINMYNYNRCVTAFSEVLGFIPLHILNNTDLCKIFDLAEDMGELMSMDTLEEALNEDRMLLSSAANKNGWNDMKLIDINYSEQRETFKEYLRLRNEAFTSSLVDEEVAELGGYYIKNMVNSSNSQVEGMLRTLSNKPLTEEVREGIRKHVLNKYTSLTGKNPRTTILVNLLSKDKFEEDMYNSYLSLKNDYDPVDETLLRARSHYYDLIRDNRDMLNEMLEVMSSNTYNDDYDYTGVWFVINKVRDKIYGYEGTFLKS